MENVLADAVSNLETQVRRAKSEIESLRGAKASLEEQRLELEAKHEELGGVKAALEKGCEKLEKENLKLQANNEELRKEVEELALAARAACDGEFGEVASAPEVASERTAEFEDGWKAEKSELKTRVTDLVSGLEQLLEATRV